MNVKSGDVDAAIVWYTGGGGLVGEQQKLKEDQKGRMDGWGPSKYINFNC